MLNPERKIDLAKYMVQKAENDIDTAKILLNMNKYEASINRSYYAIFSCMRAVLALDVIEFKKHSGIISYFFTRRNRFILFYTKFLLSL